mmetsp:Transcript_20113/g.66582  ORF Transcript_20113/g.66582 Transcript_20113/m.66582 type:complete len:311 (-) Transcript_20113:216-1148(-)
MGRDGPRWGRVWPSLPKAAGDGLPEGRWVAAQRLGERGLAQVVRKREVEAGLSYRLKPTRIPLVRRDVHRHARRKACASQSRSDVGRLPVEDGAPALVRPVRRLVSTADVDGIPGRTEPLLRHRPRGCQELAPKPKRRPQRRLGVGAHPPPPHEAAADAQHARRPATQQRHSAGGRAPSRHVVVARRRSDRRPADLHLPFLDGRAVEQVMQHRRGAVPRDSGHRAVERAHVDQPREGHQLKPRFSHLTVDAVWRNRRQDENTAQLSGDVRSHDEVEELVSKAAKGLVPEEARAGLEMRLHRQRVRPIVRR